MLQDGAVYAESIQFMAMHALTLIWLGDAHRRADRVADASATIIRALEVARLNGQRAAEAEVFLTVAAIHGGNGPSEFEVARSAAHHALALADELGARPLIARGHLLLGHLLRQAGVTTQAGEHLARATAMFTDMGMDYWLDQAASPNPQVG